MSKFLEGLNPSQALAVQTIDGATQINAVAGSGKTRVLTHRIAYMLEQGIKPQSILCTTFTKKATDEMTDRLSKLISKHQLMFITMGTTHSIAYRILSKEYKAMSHRLASCFDPRNRDGLLVNGSLKRFGEQVKKAIMYDRTVPYSIKEQLTDMSIPSLLKVAGLSKNNYKDAYDFQAENSGKGPRMEAYIEFFTRYERMKTEESKMDMDDLLFNLIRLFERSPEILAKYQKIYKYLLIDEAQDNNKLQYMLIRMLGYPEYNVFVVGDDDQSMYSFRGAKPEEFINFCENYNGANQINLEDNYRSNPGILDVANKLIANNTVRLTKSLKAHKPAQQNSVMYSIYETSEHEAQHTVHEIKTLVDKEGFSYKDIAVLYRTNAQSRAFEDYLITSGMPYVIHGGISFYERKEVKDICAYLELAVDQGNNKAFSRVVNVPSRYLGKAFMEKVRTHERYFGGCMKAASKDYERRGIQSFVDVVNTLKDMVEQGLSTTELVDYILDDNGIAYRKYLLDDLDEDDEEAKMENINTLKYVLNRFPSIEDFLAYINTMLSTAKFDINGVQLMTVHKSKGLEFPVVFVAGANEGLLPHFKSIEAEKNGIPLATEEERRLMYVAVTRAESRCYVSSSESYEGRPSTPSRFTREMGLMATPVEELEDTKITLPDPIQEEMDDDMVEMETEPTPIIEETKIELPKVKPDASKEAKMAELRKWALSHGLNVQITAKDEVQK